MKKAIRGSCTSLFLLLAISIQSQSIFENQTDVRSHSMGKLQALSTEFINPSYLSFQTRPIAGLSVQNKFQIKELNMGTLSFIFPNRLLDAGIKVSSFGFEDYRITRFSGGIGKKITPSLSIGTSIHYITESFSSIEKDKIFLTSDIGTFYQILPNWELALLVQNLLKQPAQKQVFSIGVNHKASDIFLFAGEISTDHTIVVFRTGIEYRLFDTFFIRTGIYTHPTSPTLGFAFTWNSLLMDIGIEYHQWLGYSTSIAVNYLF